MTEFFQWRRSLLICLGLAAVIAAVYWPVQRFEFINFDDRDYVTDNLHVQSGLTLNGLAWALTTRDAGNWHPLTWLSHMLDCQFYGLRAGGHHVTSVLFHVFNTLLLFLVLKRMTGALWRSAFVAALFGVHPLHVESVAWVAERKDVLSTCLGMLTLWAYTRYVENREAQSAKCADTGLRSPLPAPPSARSGSQGTDHATLFYGLALLFFALGLMAKPMLVTLPFLLLLLDYWPLCRFECSPLPTRHLIPLRLVREKVPFLVLTAGSCLVTYWAQQRSGAVAELEALPFGARAANAVVAYVRYLGKALWPEGLAVFYPYQFWPLWTVAGATAVLAVVTLVVFLRARREPWLGVGWFWYVGTLVPVIGLVQVGGQALADRYTYIPLVGLLIAAAWSVSVAGTRFRKTLFIIAATGCVIICGMLSAFQVRCWKDSDTLFGQALAVTTGNYMAHDSLGFVLAQQGKLPEAVEHYEQALQIRPDYANAHVNLGVALFQQGKVPEAIGQYEQALRCKPGSAEVHMNLGNALDQQGRAPEAIGQYEQALRYKPANAEAHYNLAWIYLRQGQVAEAIRHYEQALRYKPDFAQAHNNLAEALRSQGRVAEAIGHYEQALRLQPDLVQSHVNLGIALFQQGHGSEAIRHLDQGLRLKPDDVGTQYKLAWVLATCPDGAVRNGVRAVELAERANNLTGGKSPTILDTLAVAYAAAGRFGDAMRTAQIAIDLLKGAGQAEAARPIEDRLKLYQAGQPYREGSASAR